MKKWGWRGIASVVAGDLRAARRRAVGQQGQDRDGQDGRTLAGQPASTPTEREVAELVGSGLTNREVAHALFLSVSTVEANLRRIYQKVGVRSRTELSHRLSER
jgi:DNA-binding NarL/FixJ family response regulator